MKNHESNELQLSRLEWFLLGAAGVMFVAGLVLVVLSPTAWGWYLYALDIRCWSFRKSLLIGTALVESLLLVRFWPNKED